MKKAIVILMLIMSGLSSFSQESGEKPVMLLRLYAENGVEFMRNDFLKQSYQSQSKYSWGVGFQLGHPYEQALLPFIQFNYSSLNIKQEVAPEIIADSTLSSKQLSAGVIIPLFKVQDMYFRARAGVGFGEINESFNNISSLSKGIIAGVRVEKKIIGYTKIYIDFSYNLQKTSSAGFKDFDVTKLTFGIMM